ncbi:MAG: hypothetical protein R3C03_20835 [Pirellulaceae bacterium]
MDSSQEAPVEESISRQAAAKYSGADYGDKANNAVKHTRIANGFDVSVLAKSEGVSWRNPISRICANANSASW